MGLRDQAGQTQPAQTRPVPSGPPAQRSALGGARATPPVAPLGSLRDRWVRSNPALEVLYRAAVGLVGALVVLTGVVLLPLPGPGWLIIFCGLAVLATEFVWAQRLLRFARAQVARWTRWAAAQSLAVRGSMATATAAAVAGAAWVYLVVVGTPGWVPGDVVALLADTVPGIE